MKTINRLLTMGAIVAMLALPVLAKSATSNEFALQDPCTEESKTASYAAFVETRKTDQDKAYEHAKKYLACPTEGATEATQKIIDYLKKWVNAYEDLKEKGKFPDLLYNQRKYQEAYDLGMKLLARDPENLKMLIDLGANGYLVQGLKNPALNAEAIKDARKALSMLEAGKTIEQWAPLSGKDEAMAYLNYTIGVFTVEQDPGTALKNLLKAAQFETQLKKAPQTYAYIAVAYDNGPYAKQSEEYTQKFGGKDETPESKLAVANINQVVDRVIDAYARAVALATDPKLATQKQAWQARLTELYKYRFKSDAGMTEFIAAVLNKPLPPEPTPLTSLPSEPAPIGTSGTSTTGSSTASSTTPAGVQSTTPANGAAKPGTTKTATPTGPGKPKNN